MKKVLLPLLFIAAGISAKTEEDLLQENKQHLPAEFLENKDYGNHLNVPLWLQQRCAYVASKAALQKKVFFTLSDHNHHKRSVAGSIIALDLEDHSNISLDESLYIIGHEMGHAQVYNFQRNQIRLSYGLFGAVIGLQLFKIKSPLYNNGLALTSFVNLLTLVSTGAPQNNHFNEFYADLKACDLIDNNKGLKGGIIRGIKYNHGDSESHPSHASRIKTIVEYSRWKQQYLGYNSPLLFLMKKSLSSWNNIDCSSLRPMK